MAIVGVIPAAGHATRLPDLVGSKETITVGGQPVMDYLIERMRLAGADSIRVVTRAAKLDVLEHARSKSLEVILAEPRSPGQSIAIGASGLKPDDIVLLGFPDSIWEPPEGFSILLGRLSHSREVVLGLFSSSEAERSDVVVLEESGRVAEILVKPVSPSSDLIWGCAVARRRSLNGIALADQPGQHLNTLCQQGRVDGIKLSSRYLDIGTQEVIDRIHGGDGRLWT